MKIKPSFLIIKQHPVKSSFVSAAACCLLCGIMILSEMVKAA